MLAHFFIWHGFIECLLGTAGVRDATTNKSFLKKPFSGGGGNPENMHFPCVTKSIVKIIIQYA